MPLVLCSSNLEYYDDVRIIIRNNMQGGCGKPFAALSKQNRLKTSCKFYYKCSTVQCTVVLATSSKDGELSYPTVAAVIHYCFSLQ